MNRKWRWLSVKILRKPKTDTKDVFACGRDMVMWDV